MEEFGELPKELEPFGRYFYAAKVTYQIDEDVSSVMLHEFSDLCQEQLPRITSASTQEFADKVYHSLKQFPQSGPQKALTLADSFFDSLTLSFQTGRINTMMPKQYALCSVFYSVLDGDHAIKMEKLCKSVAVLIQRMLNNNKKSEAPASTAYADQVNVSNVKPATVKPSGDTPEAMAQVLVDHGFPINPNPPPFGEMESAVQRNLDLAVFTLKRGDKSQGLVFLERALAAWKDGKSF